MIDLDRASALYWLPRLEEGGLPTPETRVVRYDHDVCLGIEGDPQRHRGAYLAAMEEIERVAEEVFCAQWHVGMPAFVRTDLASAKHDGPSSYVLTGPDSAPRVVHRTVVDNELKFGLGGPTPKAFLVRHWLDIASGFRAFGGHPIGHEWRYFASPEGFECRHFYWPEEAISYGADRDDWATRLHQMASAEPPDKLEKWALAAAGLMGDNGSWSIDFAQTTSGQWFLIDMAPAQESWHPEHGEG